jgi:hypothetical protein
MGGAQRYPSRQRDLMGFASLNPSCDIEQIA